MTSGIAHPITALAPVSLLWLKRAVSLPLLGLLLLAAPALAEPSPSGAGLFALSFDGGNWDKCPGRGPVQCVLGKIPKQQALLLLGSQDSATCPARATRSFESEWDSGSFPLTLVDTSACPQFRYALAVRAKTQLSYRLLRPAALPTPPAEKQREIEAAVRRAAPGMQASGPEHKLALAASKPQIFRLTGMDAEAHIVVFENSATPGDQAHFLHTRAEVKLIHSAASIASVFSLDNEHFIHYKFTCRVGCGYMGDFVVQFHRSGFQVRMFDASTST